MQDIEQLRPLIRSAFPSEPFRGAVTGGCHCDECVELERSLRGRSWEQLSDETMAIQFGSLPLLTGEAFQIFLPAWLMRSLEDLGAEDYKIRVWTTYELAIYRDEEDGSEELARKTEWVRSRKESLTPEQIGSVRMFLEVIRQRCPFSDWDRESIDRALDLVWRHDPNVRN